MKIKFVFLIYFACFTNCFNFLNFTDVSQLTYPDPLPKLDQDLQEELDLFNRARDRTKLVACKLLVRNALAEKRHPSLEKIAEIEDKQTGMQNVIEKSINRCSQMITEKEVLQIFNPVTSSKYDSTLRHLIEIGDIDLGEKKRDEL